MSVAICIECEDPVERTGEEALYIDGEGPFCEKCFDWRVLEEEHEAVVKELKTEIERLKALNKMSEGQEVEACHTWQEERAAVVEWLRKQWEDHPCVPQDEGIEAGEHWPAGGTP